MLKNDTLINGTVRIGLCGSAPWGAVCLSRGCAVCSGGYGECGVATGKIHIM